MKKFMSKLAVVAGIGLAGFAAAVLTGSGFAAMVVGVAGISAAADFLNS